MPPKEKDKDENVAKIDGLTKAFGDMTAKFDALPKQIGESVTRSITGLVDRQRADQDQNSNKADDNKDDDPMPSSDELEKLSRNEFASHLMKQLGKVLDTKLKPFQDSLSTTVEANERDKVVTKFDAARKSHPDFDEWKDEMGELIQKRGYLDPDELYILVRARDPEKVKQIDEASAKKEAETKEQQQERVSDESKNEAKTTFLGLLPTSSAKKEGEPEYKTAKEAASAAFDNIMGGIDERLIGENSQT